LLKLFVKTFDRRVLLILGSRKDVEELEGKLVGVDVEKLMKRLMELSIPLNAYLQDDLLFHQDDQLFRVRTEGKKYILTYKDKLVKKGNLKSRNEIEFEVSDPKAAIDFFSAIGVDTSLPESRKKKLLRFEFHGAKGELVFIHDLPPTLELEGDEDAIKEACKDLKLDFSKLLPISWSDVSPVKKD